MMDIDEFTSVGTETARKAGKLLLERYATDFDIRHKGTIDLVTEVDIAAEEMIVTRLRKAFPDHSILAEEKNSTILIIITSKTPFFIHISPFIN